MCFCECVLQNVALVNATISVKTPSADWFLITDMSPFSDDSRGCTCLIKPIRPHPTQPGLVWAEISASV